MSELIDRQETIKEFCKQDCDCDPKDCPNKTCYEVEIIESVPSVQPQWIPVSERLPEEGTEVLGTDRNGCIRHVYKDKTGLYEFATVEEGMHIGIVAWMPLPDSYKEDKT